MRVLHVIASLNPEAGGPTNSLNAILRNGPSDYRGEVASLDPPDAPFLRNLPFPVHPLGPISNNYGYTRRLVPWLRANADRFDAVIVSGLWNYVSLAVWRAFSGKKPYMVFTHGMLDPYFKRQYPLKHFKKWLYWVAAQYWVLRGAYRVLFTTEAEAHLARQSFWLHHWNPTVVSYGTTGSLDEPSADLDAFFQLQPDFRGRRFLLFLGRIHPKKGCDLLVDAFARIAAADPSLHLVMAGPDQQGWCSALGKRAGEAGIGNRVHWPGMLTGAAKWGALRAAEAFILPSHQENFGIAVAEALSVSCPVLLSDKVNIAPDIAQQGAGFMEADTLDGTIRLLQSWLATSPERRQCMSEQASLTFQQRYDMRANAAQIIRLFDGALRTRHAQDVQHQTS